jgi:hypothetical protein
MRWILKGRPSRGAQRTITKFLFLPMAIGLEVRWLEMVSFVESYDDIGSPFCRWRPIYFVNNEGVRDG